MKKVHVRFSCIFSHRSWKTEVFVVSFILSIWAYSFYRFLNIIYQTVAKGKTDTTVSVSAAFNSFDSFYNELTTASSPLGTYYSSLTGIKLLSQYMREEDMAIMLLMLQSFSLTCWRKKFLQIFQSVARHPQLLCWHVATIPSSLRWLTPDPTDPSDPTHLHFSHHRDQSLCAKVGLSPHPDPGKTKL